MASNPPAGAGARVPPVPLVLGIAGLAPFVAGASMPWLGPSMWPMATAVYAACILAFMGGVQWGALLASGGNPTPAANLAYLLSVVPAPAPVEQLEALDLSPSTQGTAGEQVF